MITTEYLTVQTKGNTDVLDITDECQGAVVSSGMTEGILTVFNPGSTGGLTTIEYEPNLVKDLKNALEIFAPTDKVYEHSKTWHDDNGSSHVRSSLMGPSITVPFYDGTLTLGTWQQIVFCDFDTRPRERRLVLQVIGE
ncbi:MAG: secondary thiamine-phosphate synthase enzyme YjbQ [Candidatus Tantalella remota]|nr:secondary thiamine-phosphate synthase enzyme YjbQ [Candidatus Tantalella remota]